MTGAQVKLHQFRRRPSLPAGSGDSITIVAFITFIFVVPSTPWHPKMKFVIHAIVVYQDFGSVLSISGSSSATWDTN
jgi:hypothetical protein